MHWVACSPTRETQTSPKNPQVEITSSSSKPHPYSAEGCYFQRWGKGRTQGREQGCPLLRIEAILLSPTQDFTSGQLTCPARGALPPVSPPRGQPKATSSPISTLRELLDLLQEFQKSVFRKTKRVQSGEVGHRKSGTETQLTADTTPLSNVRASKTSLDDGVER